MSLSDFMNELEEMAEEDSDNSQRISGEDGYSYSGSSSDESIDAEEQGKETIFRILSDDGTLTKLDMGGETYYPWGDNDSAVFMFDNRSEITRLGVSIATNIHLVRFAFHSSFYESAVFGIKDVIDGLEKNSSITELVIRCPGRITRPSQEILNVYMKKRCLTRLSIDNANLHAATLPLCETLRVSTNLQTIKLEFCNISDEQLQSILEVIRGHNLVELLLPGNRIGNAGCETLATLLEDNNCSLQSLSLSRNAVSDDGATSIANSLANNTTLIKFYIEGSPIDTRVVQDAFSVVMCNTSSIMDTYHSNHTLQTLSAPQPICGKCMWLRSLNEDTNKSHVAIKKILQYHPNIDMTPLFELDMKEGDRNLKGLPYVITLFEVGMVEASPIAPECNIEARKLSAIYQFAQAMPLMFVPASHIKVDDKKRKREDVREDVQA